MKALLAYKNIFLIMSCCFIFTSYSDTADQIALYSEDYYDITKSPLFLDTKMSEIKALAPHGKKIANFVWVHMAADNDLQLFADRNLEQMKQVGSNENLLIFVHLDIKRPRGKKITQRFIVFKNKLAPLGTYEAMDSGDEKTLIDAARIAFKELPEKYDLEFERVIFIAWNHGMGQLNPIIRMFNSSRLFRYNPETRMIELDRSVGFIDFIHGVAFQDYEYTYRGVFYDQSTGNYLTEQKFRRALEIMCQEYRDGKKLDVIGFDACLMASIEGTINFSEFADYAVFSQEAVPGTGWDYTRVLAPLAQGAIDPELFARHIVSMYEKTYSKITNDYTQSAVTLAEGHLLNKNIDTVAKLLIEALKQQKNSSIHTVIKMSRDRKLCTHFDEPSYIDLHHFYSNLSTNISKCELTTGHATIEQLKDALADGMKIIKKLVIANVAGRNLRNATGLSIYFPEKPPIHSSYRDIFFSHNNAWLQFLIAYHGTKAADQAQDGPVHHW
jgi:Clostripain family